MLNVAYVTDENSLKCTDCCALNIELADTKEHNALNLELNLNCMTMNLLNKCYMYIYSQ